MQEKKLFDIYFLFYLKTSSLIESLILPFFLLFLFFFVFMNLLFPFFLFSYLPSFLLLLLSLSPPFSLFYAFLLRFHHLRFYG